MKRIRRTLGIAALLADISASCNGCVIDVLDIDADACHSADVEASAAFSWTLPLDGQTRIKVLGANGSVRVWGVPGAQELSVEGVRRVRSDTRSDARANLHRLRVSVSAGASVFQVRTQQPSHSDGRSYIVDYELTVPAHLVPKITHGNGFIRLEGIKADVEIQNGNGNVELVDAVGSSWISVGNGEISASVFLPIGGQLVHSLGNGAISLSVQSHVSADFRAKVGNGAIGVMGLDLQQVVSSPRELTGVLGTGQGLIDLSTGNGLIQVKGE